MDLLSHLCRAEAIIAVGGPHRISSPFNPHPRAPSQGLSSLALSKKHLSSSVSQLERTDHSLPYSLFCLSRQRFQRGALHLPSLLTTATRSKGLKGGQKEGSFSSQLREVETYFSSVRCWLQRLIGKPLPVSRKQEKDPDGNSTAFPAVVGSNLASQQCCL